MPKTCKEIIEFYYRHLAKKELEALAPFLHPEVQFSTPLAKIQGKEAVLTATKNFASLFLTLHIRSHFGSDHQAILVYDVECPQPIGTIAATSFMTFEDQLITKIELFYDARPFEPKQKEIFSTKS